MKKYILPFLILFVSINLISCDQLSKEEQEFDTIMQKIIGVHDEVMPKMGEMSTLIKELTPKIDTTNTGKAYAKAQNDLKGSYDFMMDWMSDFSTKFPHDQDVSIKNKAVFDSKMKLLKEEAIEVNTLKEKINSSILNAKKLLERS